MTKMAKEEIIKRIEEINTDRFYLAMKDNWDRRDYDLDIKWYRELVELRELLKKI